MLSRSGFLIGSNGVSFDGVEGVARARWVARFIIGGTVAVAAY